MSHQESVHADPRPSDAIITVDAQRRVRQFNPAAEQMFGFRAPDIECNPLSRLVPERFQAALEDSLGDLARSGAPVRPLGMSEEFRVQHADGHECRVNGYLCRTSGGDDQQCTLILRDLTAEEVAREAQRRSEERLRLALEAAFVISFEWDIQRDEVRRYTSTTAALPPTTERTLGTLETVREVVHPEDRERFMADIQAALEDEDGRYASEFRIVTPEGAMVWLSERGRVQRDAQGRPARLIGLSQDITERKRVEEALRASETRLAGMVDAAMDAIISVDEAQRIRLFNVAAERVFGISAGEAIGLPLARLIPERFHPVHERHVREFAQQGVTTRRLGTLREMRGVRANGEEFPIEASISQVTVGGSKLLTVILRDITERKRAEEALSKSQAQLRVFVEQAPISIAMLDRQMTYIATSARWVEQYGRGHTDLVGRNHCELHPDLPEKWKQVHREPLAGTPARNDADLWIQADGSWRWLRWAVHPWTDEQGEVGGIIIAAEDTTEQKLVEEALRDSQADLNRAQAVGHIGSWRLNLRRNELSWSAENYRIFGVPEGTPMTYESFLAAVHPEDREYVHRMWKAGLDGEPYDIEHRLIVNAEVKWVRERAELEFDADGALLGGFGTTQDITERKRAEEALREADRRKDEFLAILAHELRNPLEPIFNAVEILKLQGSAGASTRTALEMIDRQVRHVARLIDDLTEVSRITRGKLQLHRERVDLVSVLEHALETARPQLQRAGHALWVSLPPPPIDIDADPARLAQVVTNLLTNASKYTPRGGRIELSAARDGEEVVVKVTDTGIGVAPEQLPRLFEMFTQVDSARSVAQGGLGIGLWLARDLVEMHGGRIEAKSDGLGTGTAFIVRLPALGEAAVTQPVEPDRTAEPQEAAPEPKALRRILVVDDNPDIAASMAMLLRLHGHEVETAQDGLEGIEAAERLRPDVVLLDIGMPRLDGYAVCRRIRERPWGKDVTIVALTGWGQENDRRKSEEAGFDAHLVKPVKVSLLLKLLADPPSAQA